jgi:hypothetical protein
MLKATMADYERKSRTKQVILESVHFPFSKRSTQRNLEHVKLLYKRTELPVEEELSLQPDGTRRDFRQECSRDLRGSIAAIAAL